MRRFFALTIASHLVDWIFALSGGLALLVMGGCAQTPEKPPTVFYPMPPQVPRVQFLTTINDETDIGAGPSAFQQFLAGRPEELITLIRPWDIAHEPGRIYVIDKQMNQVVIFDLNNREVDFFKHTKGGNFRNPSGIWVTEDGSKWVADADHGQILAFGPDNEFYRAYGSKEQFRPTDVAVHGNRIYVCDQEGHEIEVLDRDSGAVLFKIGKLGTEEGEFQWPTHITLDAQGNLFVTDFFNFRIQQLDANGKFLKSFGRLGDSPGAMPRPKGLAVDDNQHLYVADAAFELIQIFDVKTGEILLPFGKFGSGRGGTYLPAGVEIDYDNVGFFSQYVDERFRPEYLIYVANQIGEDRVNVYAFGQWQGPDSENFTVNRRP